MHISTDVCVHVVFVWKETEVPGGNPPVWLGDHMTRTSALTTAYTVLVTVYLKVLN